MKAEELRKYDKETLVKYLSENLLHSSFMKTELDQIQSRMEFDKLMDKSAVLLEEMKKCDANSYEKWNQLFQENQKIQKKIDKHLGI